MFNGLISSAKIWLTVCLAVLVSFATTTPDIHPVELDEIVCQDEAGPNQESSLTSDDSDHPTGPEHDHHTHNCGSCHVHAIYLRLASANGDISIVRVNHGFNQFDASPRAGPLGLYRPPRA